MKVTTKFRYGLRAMVVLALNYDRAVLVKEIADQEEISRKYLDSVLMELKNAGLIRSIRGAKGGYMLAKPPEKITILEIAQALEGSPDLVDCVENPKPCARYQTCSTVDFWKNLSETIKNFLKGSTLADLAKKAQEKREQATLLYYI